MSPVWSSGTTGHPICVYRNQDDDRRFWQKLFNAANFLPDSLNPVRVLFLCVLPKGKQYTSLTNLGSFQLSITRLNIFQTDLRDIETQQPDMITTSPVGLRWLVKNPRLLHSANLRLLYSTALPIDNSFFESVCQESEAPLLHTYSTTETGPIAYYCSQLEGYHVYPDIFAETIQGDLIISKLYRSALPLLRYATGDKGEITQGICRCGFSGLNIHSLMGRKQ